MQGGQSGPGGQDSHGAQGGHGIQVGPLNVEMYYNCNVPDTIFNL